MMQEDNIVFEGWLQRTWLRMSMTDFLSSTPIFKTNFKPVQYDELLQKQQKFALYEGIPGYKNT